MHRDILIVSGVALVAVALGVFFLLYGPNGFPGISFSAVTNNRGPVPAVVSFTNLVQGTRSNVPTRANYLITSPTELSELWKLINATTTPPKIDFEKNTVIAVFAGRDAGSAVASIAVARIEDTNARMVSITVAKPDNTCTRAKEVVSPYDIVVVPATSLPLSHEDFPMIVGCSAQ